MDRGVIRSARYSEMNHRRRSSSGRVESRKQISLIQRWTWSRKHWTVAAGPLVVLARSMVAAADKSKTPAVRERVPANRMVLRVSQGMLNALWGNPDIDRQADVRDYILGTTIYGRARVIGSSRVQLAESPDQAKFHMIFQGTAHSRTTGY